MMTLLKIVAVLFGLGAAALVMAVFFIGEWGHRRNLRIHRDEAGKFVVSTK